ncbi:MAG: threonine/serine exporter ThrE family protein [Lachnospirales bacterium]
MSDYVKPNKINKDTIEACEIGGNCSYLANRDLLFAIDIGALMLANGGETSRVEDTIERILNSSENCVKCSALVRFTGIIVSYIDTEYNTHTMVERITSVKTNLTIISELNGLCRLYSKGLISYEVAHAKFEEIKIEKVLKKRLTIPLYGVRSCLFCFMISGSLLSTVASFFASVLTYAIVENSPIRKISSGFMIVMIKSFVVVVCSVFTLLFFQKVPISELVIAAIIPLVPGLETVTGVRDLVEGNFLSATARLLNAFLIGISIAIGVGIPLAFFQNLMMLQIG